jgi:SMODS domain-containing protein
MGGSGGGSYFSSDPRKTLQQLRAARSETETAAFDIRCNESLMDLLGQYNNRDNEAVGRRLDEIKAALDDELDGTVDLRFGGSLAKHTFVDGLSDVDSLVLLDKCELVDRPPSDAKEYLAERLRETLADADVTTGNLAVTARFPEIEVQLLPAVSCEGGVQISDPTQDRWSEIRPREFTRILSQVNERRGRRVVPVVKLAKGIIANLPESRQITGYHTESLAVDIFRDYRGGLNHKEMLRHFFAQAAERVKSPIRDRTGQSVHVDDYLGRENSLERRILSDAFARIVRRMNNADSAASVDQWVALFGD